MRHGEEGEDYKKVYRYRWGSFIATLVGPRELQIVVTLFGTPLSLVQNNNPRKKEKKKKKGGEGKHYREGKRERESIGYY